MRLHQLRPAYPVNQTLHIETHQLIVASHSLARFILVIVLPVLVRALAPALDPLAGPVLLTTTWMTTLRMTSLLMMAVAYIVTDPPFPRIPLARGKDVLACWPRLQVKFLLSPSDRRRDEREKPERCDKLLVTFPRCMLGITCQREAVQIRVLQVKPLFDEFV